MMTDGKLTTNPYKLSTNKIRFTKPWGVKGGKPGRRSRKVLYQYSVDAKNPPVRVLPSKCDHIRVAPGDLLEWSTWGGGGFGDPFTRPAEKVALEVHRKLVTFEGAKKNYGVIVNAEDFSVNEAETEALRKKLKDERGEIMTYDRGGDLATLSKNCLDETGLPAPKRQWESTPYGPHTGLDYVQSWYKTMKEKGGWDGL